MVGLNSTPSPTPTIMEAQPVSSREVSVQDAKESFAELERQLSRASTLQKSFTTSDPEKGEGEEELFNLREYLTTANVAQDEAGITNHHKRVGVTWQDLEVIVPGGFDYKVIGNLTELVYVSNFLFKDLCPDVWTYVLVKFISLLCLANDHPTEAVINFCIFPAVYVLGVFRQFLNRNVESSRTAILHKYATQSLHVTLYRLTPFHRNNGVLKPGEMCLVLGCPGSGCTTFLKAISNQRDDYAHVGGDVRYAGIDASEMEKRYRGEVVYNGEGILATPLNSNRDSLMDTLLSI